MKNVRPKGIQRSKAVPGSSGGASATSRHTRPEFQRILPGANHGRLRPPQRVHHKAEGSHNQQGGCAMIDVDRLRAIIDHSEKLLAEAQEILKDVDTGKE